MAREWRRRYWSGLRAYLHQEGIPTPEQNR